MFYNAIHAYEALMVLDHDHECDRAVVIGIFIYDVGHIT